MSKQRKARLCLVVVFDAMPKLWDCIPGCYQKETHLCKHRFPSGVHVIAHTTHLSRPGLSDLHVVMHIMKQMWWGISGNRLGETPWVLFTSDRTFWNSAKHECASLNGEAPHGLVFPKKNVVLARVGERDVRLDIKYIPHTQHGPDKDIRIRRAVQRAEQIIEESAP